MIPGMGTYSGPINLTKKQPHEEKMLTDWTRQMSTQENRMHYDERGGQHEGVHYPCDKAILKGNIMHEEYKHKSVRYHITPYNINNNDQCLIEPEPTMDPTSSSYDAVGAGCGDMNTMFMEEDVSKTRRTNLYPRKDNSPDETENYQKQVRDNIKKMLLESPSPIFQQSFRPEYRRHFGDEIDLQKLGQPGLQDYLAQLSIVDLEYKNDHLMISPSRALVEEDRAEKRAAQRLVVLQQTVAGDADHRLRGQMSTRRVIKQVEFPVGLKELDVIVTDVSSPGKFWVQIVGNKTSKALDKLMDAMEELYSRDRSMYCIADDYPLALLTGAFLAAPYPDSGYHRVLVDNLYKGAMGIVNVFYIDYGTRGRVPVSHLRHLPLEFTVLPAQALTANLWGLTPTGGSSKWPSEATTAFYRLVSPSSDCGGNFAEVKNTDPLSLVLYDYTMTGDQLEEIKINDKMVEMRMADYSVLSPSDRARQRRGEIGKGKEVARQESVDQGVLRRLSESLDSLAVSPPAAAATGRNSAGGEVRVKHLAPPYDQVPVIIHNRQAWMASGDISRLMPAWKGRDILETMLKLKGQKLNEPTARMDWERTTKPNLITREQDYDVYKQLVVKGLTPKKDKQFDLHLLNNVITFLDVFGKESDCTEQLKQVIGDAMNFL